MRPGSRLNMFADGIRGAICPRFRIKSLLVCACLPILWFSCAWRKQWMNAYSPPTIFNHIKQRAFLRGTCATKVPVRWHLIVENQGDWEPLARRMASDRIGPTAALYGVSARILGRYWWGLIHIENCFHFRSSPLWHRTTKQSPATRWDPSSTRATKGSPQGGTLGNRGCSHWVWSCAGNSNLHEFRFEWPWRSFYMRVGWPKMRSSSLWRRAMQVWRTTMCCNLAPVNHVVFDVFPRRSRAVPSQVLHSERWRRYVCQTTSEWVLWPLICGMAGVFWEDVRYPYNFCKTFFFLGVDQGHNLLVLLHHCPQSSRARAHAIVKFFRAVTLVRSTAQFGCPWSGVPACMAWWRF